MTAIEKQDEMLAIHEEMNEIQAKAERENRENTQAEMSTANRLMARFNELKASVELYQNIEAQAELLGRGTGRKTTPEGPNSSARQLPVNPGGKMGSGQRPEATALFKDLQTGATIFAHGGTSPIAPPCNDPPIGEALRAGGLNSLSVKAAVTSGFDTGGGHLQAPAQSGQLVDLARSASVCLKAGGMTIQMDGSELTLARILSDPQTYWRGELMQTPSSAPTFGRYVLRPKMLACLVAVSLEILEDSVNGAQVLEQVVRSALAQELDRAILCGMGSSNEPLGITATSGINEQTSVGTITDYAEITNSVRDVLDENYSGEVAGLSWILPPRVAGVYDSLVTGISGDRSPLMPSPWASQLRRLHTTSLAPTGSPARYQQIVGDFGQLLIGLRYSGVLIDWLDAGTATDADGETINAASQFARILRIRLRADSCVMRPGFFSVMSGIAG